MKQKWLNKAGWFIGYTLIFLLLIYLAFQSLIFWRLVQDRAPEAFSFAPGRRIGVLSVKGPLADVQPLLDRVNNLKKRSDIEALLVDINSPGGTVGPTQELSQAVRRWRESTQKPVVSFIRNVGASGGYHVAVSADTVVANPGSIVGSIGVMMQFVKAQELVDKIGLEYEVIKSGQFKDLSTPLRKMDPAEREVLKSLVMDVYDQFIGHVATRRESLGRQEVQELADGRVFTGRQARSKGLIDLTGGRRKALDVVKKSAGLEGNVVLDEVNRRRGSWLEIPAQLSGFLSQVEKGAENGVKLLYKSPVSSGGG